MKMMMVSACAMADAFAAVAANPGTDVTDILFPKKPDAEVGQPAAKH
ncbi:MAG: hypothetical protein IJG84_16000 [Kiritimatiellae bacterium]|nr:hypothetical protein [Kiritimatiellia bacterium]